MISNQILQNTLDGLKNISRSDFCVADTEGKILAFTAQNPEISSSDILGFAASPADSQVVQENQFFKVYDENRLEYVLVVSGGSEDTYMIGQMAAFRSRICWWPTKSALIKTILSKICYWITCFWWIFITEQKNCTLMWKQNVWCLSWKPVREKIIRLLKM